MRLAAPFKNSDDLAIMAIEIEETPNLSGG